MNGSLRAQCIAEFLGTGLFLFFGICCLSALKLTGASLGLWEICIIWGLGISLAVYLTAGISGGTSEPRGHRRPCGCLPASRAEKWCPISWLRSPARFGGAVLAWILYSTLFTQFETVHHMVRGSLESLQLASIFSTYPAPELSIWHAALVEVVITSMLMGMIMALTDDGNGVPKGPLAPLLIGILVAVIGASTGPLTGFAMNPARDFGPKLFTWFAGWGNIAMTGGRDIPYFIVPIIAPLLGACLGAAIYRFLIANNLPCHTCVEEENTR